MRIVINTFGSFGDLHPYLALADELRSRGHVPVLATMEFYREKIEHAGFEFAPVRPNIPQPKEQDEGLIEKIMEPRTGPQFLMEKIVYPAVRDAYEGINILDESSGSGDDSSGDTELESLLRIMFPERGVYVMLVARLDESASHSERHPVVSVGGIVATDIEWVDLLRRWQVALSSKGVGVYHTSEFETPEGRIGTVYEDWPDSKLVEFQSQMIEVLKSASEKALFVSANVVLSEYDAVACAPHRKRYFGDAYLFCATAVQYEIAKWASEVHGNQRIIYFFEEGGPHQGQLRASYEAIKNNEEAKELMRFYSAPNFSPKDAQPGLQMADKVVYESAKEVSHIVDDAPPANHSRTLFGRQAWRARYPLVQVVKSGVPLSMMFPRPDSIELIIQTWEREWGYL